MKANLAAVLIFVFVGVFTLTSPVATFNADVALAQQQMVTTDKPVLAQNAPKEAVPAALSEKKGLDPLLGKWKYDTNQSFVSTFEAVSVGADGNAVIKNYKVNGRDVPHAKLVASNEKGVIRVGIRLGEGAWDLTYSTVFGGMLDGTFTPSGRAPISGKFYKEK
ncbi:MAG: hypothetical protein UW76_C0015G0007 [Parcubacteria group bacterium GW2011_GWF2_44_8b]|nr:MAG: hypothetical protein UV94_C0006G0059 [Parcubacteria group bacterium GW2011_GWC1_43_30]KKT80524.1 MAG: hypothetical protein UW76_C0015G0007 [Parcubacteria group bacterium GW2011_GWF2_44_8b]